MSTFQKFSDSPVWQVSLNWQNIDNENNIIEHRTIESPKWSVTASSLICYHCLSAQWRHGHLETRRRVRKTEIRFDIWYGQVVTMKQTETRQVLNEVTFCFFLSTFLQSFGHWTQDCMELLKDFRWNEWLKFERIKLQNEHNDQWTITQWIIFKSAGGTNVRCHPTCDLWNGEPTFVKKIPFSLELLWFRKQSQSHINNKSFYGVDNMKSCGILPQLLKQ